MMVKLDFSNRAFGPKKICLLVVLAWGAMAIGVQAQRPLSLADAVAMALQNNYRVRLSQNDAAAAHNNLMLGTGGFMPMVTANAAYTEVRNTTRQERYDGTVNEKDNARSTNSSANVQMAWVLFDGMGMFIENRQYLALDELGKIKLRETIENTVAEVVMGYYSVVQQQKELEVLNEALALSKQRAMLAGARFRLGSASETDVLQSAIDVNVDSAAILNGQSALANTRADMCLALGLGTTEDWVATDTLSPSCTMLYADLLDAALLQNAGLAEAVTEERIALLLRKMANSPKYPKLTFNAQYSGSLAEAEVGLLRSNRNSGPSAGVALSYPLFQGFRTSTQAKNARLQHQNAQIRQQYAAESLKADLLKMYNDYTNQQAQVNVAVANVALARRNVQLAWERYRLGQISDLDFRQLRYVRSDAENRLLNVQWECKRIETELLRLSGKLVGQAQ